MFVNKFRGIQGFQNGGSDYSQGNLWGRNGNFKLGLVMFKLSWFYFWNVRRRKFSL